MPPFSMPTEDCTGKLSKQNKSSNFETVLTMAANFCFGFLGQRVLLFCSSLRSVLVPSTSCQGPGSSARPASSQDSEQAGQPLRPESTDQPRPSPMTTCTCHRSGMGVEVGVAAALEAAEDVESQAAPSLESELVDLAAATVFCPVCSEPRMPEQRPDDTDSFTPRVRSDKRSVTLLLGR